MRPHPGAAHRGRGRRGGRRRSRRTVSIALGPQIAAAVHFSAAAGCEICEYNPHVFSLSNLYLDEPLRFDASAYVTPAQAPGLGAAVNLVRVLSERVAPL